MVTIVTRSGKGSPLTNAEVDSNFTNLNSGKLETSGGSVTGSLTISGSSITDLVRITQTGGGNALVVEDETNPDNTPFVVDTNGSVGIGTASPSAKLHVDGTTYIDGTFEVTGQSLFSGVVEVGPVAGEGGELRLYNPSGSSIGATFDVSGSNTGRVYANILHLGQLTGTGGEIVFFTETTAKARIIANGNFGIGTATPAVKLAVSSTDAILVPVGTTGERPTGATGYLRFNSSTNSFEGYNGTAWGSIGGGAAGGGTDQMFYLNGQTVNTSYSIPVGQNAGSFGPITVASGATVTVPSGSTWTVT